MIDWNAIATPLRPVPVEFVRMARLMQTANHPEARREFGDFADRWDDLYFQACAIAAAIDNQRGAK